ncbi:endonuclease III [Cytophagaceae bacterium DM2B3-1]|uniref:Endonuclease III n=1 Tax=Xanthocytophaga flava TaxID=3048013 RepID=A0AAE3QT08_9BACT|nr:endonuclease III [Xanthocytophaga flavus]MDJ1467101.1 endonuclease III [Xanthocytophaga flavus]MDJ1484897.1 endonuclease III [Xanthocytophaga flavus]MDJ1497403.1 endonuclease III [Xanthocytophaga flavus]
MTKKERYQHFIAYFSEHSENPQTELNFENPYQLLVAVILSAQCTDKRVNLTTPALFERFPNAFTLANSHFDELFPYIKSISYPNNKTKHLLGMAKMIISDFGGEIPETVEELQRLPGVGRKTAHVIASIVYNQPVLAVDTHVFRVSKRLGLVSAKASTPLAVEKELVKYIPTDLVYKSHHWLILHGRYICVARKPKCPECPLTNFCLFYAKLVKKQSRVSDTIQTNSSL